MLHVLDARSSLLRTYQRRRAARPGGPVLYVRRTAYSAPQVNHCASAECDDVQAVTGLLRQNRTVLISSELFGATTEPGQTFWSLHQLFAPL